MYTDKELLNFIMESDINKLNKFIKSEIDKELKNSLFKYDFCKLNKLFEMIEIRNDKYIYSYIKSTYFKGQQVNKGFRLLSCLSDEIIIKFLNKTEPIILNDVLLSRDIDASLFIKNVDESNYQYLGYQLLFHLKKDIEDTKFFNFIDKVKLQANKNSVFISHLNVYTYINKYKYNSDRDYKKVVDMYFNLKNYNGEIITNYFTRHLNDKNNYKFVYLRNAINYGDSDINYFEDFKCKISKDIPFDSYAREFILNNVPFILNKVISPILYIPFYVKKGVSSKLIINNDIIDLFSDIPINSNLLSKIFNETISNDCLKQLNVNYNKNNIPNLIMKGVPLYNYTESVIREEVDKLLKENVDIPIDFFINNHKIFGFKCFSWYTNVSKYKTVFNKFKNYFTQERLLDILFEISILQDNSQKLCIKHIYDYFTEFNPDDILIRFKVEGISIPSESSVYKKYVYSEDKFPFSKEVAKEMGMYFLSENY